MVLFYDMPGRLCEILRGLRAWTSGHGEWLGRVVVGAGRTNPRKGVREGSPLSRADDWQASGVSSGRVPGPHSAALPLSQRPPACLRFWPDMPPISSRHYLLHLSEPQLPHLQNGCGATSRGGDYLKARSVASPWQGLSWWPVACQHQGSPW